MPEIIQMSFNRKQAAKYIGVSEPTLVRYIDKGFISARKVEGRLFVLRESLDRFLKGA